MVVRLMSGQNMAMSFLDILPGVVVGLNHHAKHILQEGETVRFPVKPGMTCGE